MPVYDYSTDEFLLSFSRFCQEQNIIAEFARLHPFIRNHRLYDIVHEEHDIYYIDLTKSEDEIWKGFDKGCRSAIKKAGKSRAAYTSKGVTDDFIRQYKNHMLSLQANQEYQFSVDFFNILARVLNGHVHTSATRVHGEFNESQALILLWGDYAHYFLGTGSDSANLCLWEVIRYAKNRRCKIFNLGGGLKAGDGLESFKRSFTHDSKPFYTYRKVHNQAVYNELSKGIETEFFPAYRAERIT